VTTYELIRESVWSIDGRFLTLGTTTWRGELIPLLAHDQDDTDRFDAKLVGSVRNIHRVGNKIFGETDYEVPEGMRLTCDCDRLGETTEHPGLGVEFTGARIMGAFVDPKDKYPWKNNEEEGGEAG
jgi:hypothetical protein